MIKVLRCILQCRSDVLSLQIGIVAEDFGSLGPARQHIQDVGDPTPLTANARSAAAHLRIGSDAIETIIHRCIISNRALARICDCFVYAFGGGGGAVK
jgi:hypothetical protein